jgi:hypothetical protein
MEGVMGKYVLFFMLFSIISFPQTLLLEENFEYDAGDLISASDWDESPTGSSDIEVITGSLSYSNYPSSSVGNKIFVDGGATGRSGIHRSFSTVSGNGNTIYASFLIEVTDLSELDISSNEGDYFFDLQNSTASTSRAYVYIKQSATSNKFSIGLAKSSTASLTYSTIDMDINTTYLIVVSYIFQAGDDEVRLWINPDLSGSEPSSDLSITSGSDASDVTYIQFRQRELSGNINVDGIRVATSWTLAPLPVELTSFIASVNDNHIDLHWKTATEINNFGFEIERLMEGKLLTSRGVWEKIGFVEGYGSSNAEKEYNFTDKNVSLAGKYFYRLKQIDTDGSFDYSEVVEVELTAPSKFGISQNYPNPFNPVTTIKYTLPKTGYVTLKVYNTLGEEVAVLVNEIKEAGIYNVGFDASKLSGGVYFYRIVAGKISQVKKMILLK